MSALTPAGSTRRWRRLRRFVLTRDGYRCRLWLDRAGRHVEDGDPAADRLCLAWASHVDHVVERQAGGSDDPANLRAACALGNLARRPNGRPPGRLDGAQTVTGQSPRRWSW